VDLVARASNDQLKNRSVGGSGVRQLVSFYLGDSDPQGDLSDRDLLDCSFDIASLVDGDHLHGGRDGFRFDLDFDTDDARRHLTEERKHHVGVSDWGLVIFGEREGLTKGK